MKHVKISTVDFIANVHNISYIIFFLNCRSALITTTTTTTTIVVNYSLPK